MRSEGCDYEYRERLIEATRDALSENPNNPMAIAALLAMLETHRELTALELGVTYGN